MARRNRVTPFGEIVAAPARGTLMGNRGCLHDASFNVTKRSARTAWVTCLLEFNGRKRSLMSQGQYTELFFLDEATAFAAGHRPCATCQRERFKEFKLLWGGAIGKSDVSPSEIDEALKAQRLASASAAALRRCKLSELPEGVIVTLDANLQAAFLYWQGRLFPWAADGYGAPVSPSANELVTVITPQGICSVLSCGLLPRVHPSARSR